MEQLQETQPVEQTEAVNQEASEAVDNTVRMAEIKFGEAWKSMKMLSSRMSKKNILRAFMYSTNVLNGDYYITDNRVTLVDKDEAILAALLAQMMDLRTIIQAHQLNELLTETQGEENV